MSKRQIFYDKGQRDYKFAVMKAAMYDTKGTQEKLFGRVASVVLLHEAVLITSEEEPVEMPLDLCLQEGMWKLA
ncbi:hypothetical protein Pmani_029431 [Petrolisthes manimaculis]|uniref:Uncharacterized protein n=1 Tax=Petrolisthes manimaculis TaxID=1843537 RepID=A0AAE1TWZ3_9EUCA|nr:hypothetical protein Pmani_029431 [Petrolisthes manimaculis]